MPASARIESVQRADGFDGEDPGRVVRLGDDERRNLEVAFGLEPR